MHGSTSGQGLITASFSATLYQPLTQCYCFTRRSCKMVATFMYYALTTGAGLQTLGEEYCDILMLKGRRIALAAAPMHQQQQQQQRGNAQHLQQHVQGSQLQQQQQQPVSQVLYGQPGTQTRVLLVLLQSLGAPLLDRLMTSLDRAVEAGSIPPDSGDYSSLAAAEDLGYSYDDSCDDHRTQPGGSSNSRAVPSLLQHLQQRWQQVAQWLAPRWPDIKAWLLFLGRIHLAAFYLNGTYYEWAKRLVGITYTSISANKEQRASYRVLGYMLLVQLAISAAMQAKPQLTALRQNMSSKQLQQHASAQQQQHAVVLPDDCDWSSGSSSSWQYVEQQQQQLQQQSVLSGSSRLGSGKQCPLCLSSRANPTCTPCGHVFCWQCIAQWCTEKPECPLCRTAVVPSQLVCVYHSDF